MKVRTPFTRKEKILNHMGHVFEYSVTNDLLFMLLEILNVLTGNQL